jgi:hypothetical protein
MTNQYLGVRVKLYLTNGQAAPLEVTYRCPLCNQRTAIDNLAGHCNVAFGFVTRGSGGMGLSARFFGSDDGSAHPQQSSGAAVPLAAPLKEHADGGEGRISSSASPTIRTIYDRPCGRSVQNCTVLK